VDGLPEGLPGQWHSRNDHRADERPVSCVLSSPDPRQAFPGPPVFPPGVAVFRRGRGGSPSPAAWRPHRCRASAAVRGCGCRSPAARLATSESGWPSRLTDNTGG